VVLEINGNYTEEQKAYVRRYVAGLILAWTHDHVANIITPDVLDGWEPPEDLFSDEDASYEAASEMLGVLDNWMEEIAKLAGFENLAQAGPALDTAGTKYPIMK